MAADEGLKGARPSAIKSALQAKGCARRATSGSEAPRVQPSLTELLDVLLSIRGDDVL